MTHTPTDTMRPWRNGMSIYSVTRPSWGEECTLWAWNAAEARDYMSVRHGWHWGETLSVLVIA